MSTQYYVCPECKEEVSNVSQENGFGTQFYSDEFIYAPMLRKESELVRCKKCQSLIWLSKVKFIEDTSADTLLEDSNDFLLRMKHGYHIKELSLVDYQKALSEGVYTSDKEEFHIRKFIWWLYNDRVREGDVLCRSESDQRNWKENQLRLLELLKLGAGVEYTKMITQERKKSQKKGEDGEDDWVRVETTIDNSEKLKLMCAEINRNLGRFNESIAVLESVTDEEYKTVKKIMIEACKNRNTLVVKVSEFIH